MSIFLPSRTAEPLKAGPIGPGAGVLNTEFLLPMVLPVDQQQRMAKAVKLGTEVAYIRSAEQTISSKIADPLMGVAWHIEDPDGETIDETYKDPKAKEAYEIICHPQAALDPKDVGVVYSRNDMWEITSRHMGLCGNAAWYGEGLNDFGIPRAVMYIRPDRLEAVKEGNVLRGWLLDKRPGNSGTKLDIDEVYLFTLETPNDGVFASGLIESAMNKAILQGQIDKHFIEVLSGGGRLSGILAPKTAPITDDGVFGQMLRDWRNVTEQPESARRLQVVRAPVDFLKTTATPQELALIDLMSRNRDDLLALWHVPLSQIASMSGGGLNSGESRKFDLQTLWEAAVTPRLSRMQAVMQGQILDRFKPYLGWVPKLVFDLPTFDDDTPKYDRAQKAALIPTLYLAAFVWENRLVVEPSVTRLILVGVILIVLMNARPQGLLGTSRVEIV